MPSVECFNPCFNGFTSLTDKEILEQRKKIERFNPCFNGFTSLTYEKYNNIPEWLFCFNPCFNGFTSLTLTELLIAIVASLVSILVLMDSLL